VHIIIIYGKIHARNKKYAVYWEIIMWWGLGRPGSLVSPPPLKSGYASEQSGERESHKWS